MKYIRYRGGYKYQLAEEYEVLVTIRPLQPIMTPYIGLDTAGRLLIRSGYAWDGPSGPTIDTPSAMRGSLVHDALYQLMREGLLNSSLRKKADQELYRIVIEDGMWKWRAWLWRRELNKFGGPAADPKNKKRVLVAPKQRRLS